MSLLHATVKKKQRLKLLENCTAGGRGHCDAGGVDARVGHLNRTGGRGQQSNSASPKCWTSAFLSDTRGPPCSLLQPLTAVTAFWTDISHGQVRLCPKHLFLHDYGKHSRVFLGPNNPQVKRQHTERHIKQFPHIYFQH